MRHFEHYINGQFSAGKRQFESINPATNTPWALMPMSTSDDVDLAVQSAKRAFSAPAWANMTASERGALLLRLAEQIAEHADELADLETIDTGKIIRETRGQIAYVANYYRYYAGLAIKCKGRTFRLINLIWKFGCDVSPSAWWRRLCRGIRSCFWPP